MTQAPTLFWGLVVELLDRQPHPLRHVGAAHRHLGAAAAIPFSILYPAILLFICIGVYAVANSVFDVWMVVAVGAFGWLARVADLPAAPLLLGFVLGPADGGALPPGADAGAGRPPTFVKRPSAGR